MRTNPVARRTFLAGGAAVALAACGGSEVNLVDEPSITPSRLGVRFADGFRAPTTAAVESGPQRFPFVVIADDGFPMSQGAPESIEIELSFAGEVLSVETVMARGNGQVIPYYPLVFTPPAAGNYLAKTAFSDLAVEFTVSARADVALFQVGEPLPPFDTPTFTDGRGVDPVCTRATPCPFHEITLAEAVGNGLPTALLISTPEFCQTDVCGPAVEWLIEHGEGRTDMNFVHAEVFADPRNPDPRPFPELSPLLVDWGFEFEPALFVADATGTITGAVHFAIDSDEMAEAIATAG
ncbi:MAG: hypothetical protein ACR2P0_01510 [Acidimicrobiales bacterium]